MAGGGEDQISRGVVARSVKAAAELIKAGGADYGSLSELRSVIAELTPGGTFRMTYGEDGATLAALLFVGYAQATRALDLIDPDILGHTEAFEHRFAQVRQFIAVTVTLARDPSGYGLPSDLLLTPPMLDELVSKPTLMLLSTIGMWELHDRLGVMPYLHLLPALDAFPRSARRAA